jgi:hypothetical protein
VSKETKLLGGQGSIPGRGNDGTFSSLQPHPDQHWGPPSLLPNKYQELLVQEYSGWGMKLTTHLHLVPKLRMYGATLPPPNTSSWHGTELSTGTLPLL